LFNIDFKSILYGYYGVLITAFKNMGITQLAKNTDNP
jgi:hypothetical protein